MHVATSPTSPTCWVRCICRWASWPVARRWCAPQRRRPGRTCNYWAWCTTTWGTSTSSMRTTTILHLRPKYLGLSIAEHFKGRDYSSRAGDQQELAIIENNLGSLLNRVGDIRQARLHFEEALRLIDQTDDPYRFKVLYRALGNIYQLLGDYAKSERFLAAAVDLAEKIRTQRRGSPALSARHDTTPSGPVGRCRGRARTVRAASPGGRQRRCAGGGIARSHPGPSLERRPGICLAFHWRSRGTPRWRPRQRRPFESSLTVRAAPRAARRSRGRTNESTTSNRRGGHREVFDGSRGCPGRSHDDPCRPGSHAGRDPPGPRNRGRDRIHSCASGRGAPGAGLELAHRGRLHAPADSDGRGPRHTTILPPCRNTERRGAIASHRPAAAVQRGTRCTSPGGTESRVVDTQ